MLDYKQIDALFGAPLNTVPRPNTPFKLELWHVVVGIAGAFVIYQGIKRIHEKYFSGSDTKFTFKDSKKEETKEKNQDWDWGKVKVLNQQKS